MLDEYPMASAASTRSFQEFGGAGIRFDPSGTLWSDQIGSFNGYHPDGSSAGTMNVQDQLRAFDARGMLYAASCCSVNVYFVGIGNAAVLLRSITTTPSFACSAAADGAGNLFVSFCTAGPGVFSIWSNLDEYAPNASGAAVPLVTNAVATGPVTVDAAGNVYAAYNGSIGIWQAGTFSAGAPDRTLPIAPGNTITDIAADRAGNVYAVTRAVPSSLSAPRTLLYFAAGSASAVTLQSGAIGSVTAVP